MFFISLQMRRRSLNLPRRMRLEIRESPSYVPWERSRWHVTGEAKWVAFDLWCRRWTTMSQTSNRLQSLAAQLQPKLFSFLLLLFLSNFFSYHHYSFLLVYLQPCYTCTHFSKRLQESVRNQDIQYLQQIASLSKNKRLNKKWRARRKENYKITIILTFARCAADDGINVDLKKTKNYGGGDYNDCMWWGLRSHIEKHVKNIRNSLSGDKIIKK